MPRRRGSCGRCWRRSLSRRPDLLANRVPAVRSTALYGVVVAGSSAPSSRQAALHYGPLVVSQPLMVIVDPFVSIILGIWLFGEHFAGGRGKSSLAFLDSWPWSSELSIWPGPRPRSRRPGARRRRRPPERRLRRRTAGAWPSVHPMADTETSIGYGSGSFPPIADYGFLRTAKRLPGGTGRFGRVAVPAPAGLAQRIRGPPGSHGRYFPFWAHQHSRPAPPAICARDHGAGDDLAHPDRLAGRPGPAGGPAGGRRRSADRTIAGPRATRPPQAPCFASPTASGAGSRSWSTRSRYSNTARLTGTWDYDGEGYGAMTVQPAGGGPHADR